MTSYNTTNTIRNKKYRKTVLIFVPTCFGQPWPSPREQSVHTERYKKAFTFPGLVETGSGQIPTTSTVKVFGLPVG
jgi:hypothetical protein